MKTRLKLLVFAAFILICSTSFGQSLNFKGGYTLSWMKSEELSHINYNNSNEGSNYSYSSELKGISGYNISLGYEFGLGIRTSLEIGLRSQTRGYRMIGESNYTEDEIELYNEVFSYKYKTNNIDVPIILNTDLIYGDYNLYVRTGFYAGLITNYQYKSRYEYNSKDGEQEINEFTDSSLDPGYFFDRISLGLIGGVGIEYKGFYLESNFNVGVLPLANILDSPFTQDLSFSLGYKIKFN